MVRLEMIEYQPDSERVIRYRSVTTPDREQTLQEFLDRFSENDNPKALKAILTEHEFFRLGDRLFQFSEE